MKTFLISYDLKQPASINDYNRIRDAIKSFENWAKPLESLWLIKTELASNQIYDYLINYIRVGDKILIIHVDNEWNSYSLDAAVINWMKTGL